MRERHFTPPQDPMMPNARARSAALALLLPAWLPVIAAQNAPADVKAIEQVVESFRTSLINKDKPTYMSLFFSDKPEDIGWQFVSEDARLQDIRKAKPDAIKARQIPANNFIALIDGAVASPKLKEETFSNTKIETDGDVASVSFDYSFHDDGGRPTGAGKCGSWSGPSRAGRSSR